MTLSQKLGDKPILSMFNIEKTTQNKIRIK